MEETKKYWRGVEELNNDPVFTEQANKEFPEYLPIKDAYGDNSKEGDPATSRRDFLKLVGFSAAAVSLAACEAPVRKAIPYLNKPEEVDPGVANWYASHYINGGDYCSILVKTREGRPIKIEGNPNSAITGGGTGIAAQASVLNLYDSSRLDGFRKRNEDGALAPITQKSADGLIVNKIKEITAAGGNVRIVSSTILSPSAHEAISRFKRKYANVELVTYDADSTCGIAKANKEMFGKHALPAYDFSKADVIVSFSADFLSTWVAPVQFARQYGQRRKVSKGNTNMSRHYQFETNMSLTGANADYRFPVKVSEEPHVLVALYNALAKSVGESTIPGAASLGEAQQKQVAKAAKDLLAKKGRSLVVSGSNDVNVQLVVNKINAVLGNYGTTVDIHKHSNLRQGDDAAMGQFITDVKKGNVAAVIFYNSNPVYNHPLADDDFIKGLKKMKLSVSLSDREDETAQYVSFICPDNHYLESWSDAEPVKGEYSLGQPAIRKLFDTRQAQESFLTWAGEETDAYTFVKNNWKNWFGISDSDFNTILHDGVYSGKSVIEGIKTGEGMVDEESLATDQPAPVSSADGSNASVRSFNLSSAGKHIAKTYKAKGDGADIVLYFSAGLGTGDFANNPWLQELPDPLSKVCWDNYIAVSPAMAKEKGIKQGDLVKIVVINRAKIVAPALIQPGLEKSTVAVALGYGRTHAGKMGESAGVEGAIGVNAYKLAGYNAATSTVEYAIQGAKISLEPGSRALAQTQTHHTIMGREEEILVSTTLDKYKQDPSKTVTRPKIPTSQGDQAIKDVDLWKKATDGKHDYPNHHWGLMIDLNSCIGCSQCLIGCQAENNVPVVGREEVLNRREMHWIRIDRYYSSDQDSIEKYHDKDWKAMEDPEDYPEVMFQPMMCQHCDHAPCETVCPVAATTHSTEGLNQMVYNRCIGTRYCANNCPYKVRRFNWFSYYSNKERGFSEWNPSFLSNSLGRMVLNPDVTVRSRGVMEKCSMCVQRIQEGKLKAKIAKRELADGEVQTACQQSCPTGAITFGDKNDPKSAISKGLNEENADRAYYVIEAVNTQPNVHYLAKVRNKDNA